jgi:[ribosomal protein S5]-alanine N-acetyltransferase
VSATGLDLVQTERLVFERLALEHTAELSTLLRDPRVAKTLSTDGLPPSESEVSDSVRSKVAHWGRHGFGYWLLRERSSGKMVGRGGLQHTFIGGQDEVEVGWAVLPARWGEGFATELAQISVEVAERDLRLREIVAFTLPDNVASRRVMEKSGFIYEREVVHVGLSHVLYRRRLRDAP